MKLELHILQNFAPSNLNRDDTNSPKDCDFGGVRRARISSQCLKRAIRTEFDDADLIPEANRARRTRLLRNDVARRLAASGRDEEAARKVVTVAMSGMGLDFGDDKGTSQYLIFLGRQAIERLAEVCNENWEALDAITPDEGKELSARDAKRAARDAVKGDLARALDTVLDGDKASAVALFGRMLADRPEKNIDAASQVAHAISTHRVAAKFDYYTAVDDLNPEEETGAGMIGTVEFNSACYYRYANVDVGQLQKNLGDDRELVETTLRAFVQASVRAIPTGKQNSFGAHNSPAFAMTVVREGGLASLANAFAIPVTPERDPLIGDNASGLEAVSVARLAKHWGELTGVYGADGIRRLDLVAVGEHALDGLADSRRDSLGELVDGAVGAALGAS